MPEINWSATKSETALISAIVERLWKEDESSWPSKQDLAMDISACHLNGCPLHLAELLDADDANFYHDVYGIGAHIDRSTGKLKDCFLPRFARKRVI